MSELGTEELINCCGVVQFWGFDNNGDGFYEGQPTKLKPALVKEFVDWIRRTEEDFSHKKFLICATTIEQTNANKALEECGYSKQGPNRRIILWTKEL